MAIRELVEEEERDNIGSMAADAKLLGMIREEADRRESRKTQKP